MMPSSLQSRFFTDPFTLLALAIDAVESSSMASSVGAPALDGAKSRVSVSASHCDALRPLAGFTGATSERLYIGCGYVAPVAAAAMSGGALYDFAPVLKM